MTQSHRRTKARVSLEVPRLRHEVEFLAATARSKKLHASWVSAPSTHATYAGFVVRAKLPTRRVFLVRVRDTGALAGVLTLGDIVYGARCAAFIGYFAFEPLTRKGYISEGVALVLDFAFDELGLNRVEVNVQPGNVRSLALARRLGFRREGFSRKYLLIEGKFRDHVRTAMLAEEWRERRALTSLAKRRRRVRS